MEEKDNVMQMVDLLEPAASSELAVQVVKVMSQVRNAMYPICSIHIVDIQELVDEHEPTHGECVLNSVDFLLFDQPYNV